MKTTRAGSVVKWIGIALAAFALLVLGGYFYVKHRVTRGSEKPLEIPEVAADPKVQFSLKRNVEQHTYVPKDGAAASPGTVSLTGEELTLMITKLLPPIAGMKMQIQIVDGKADLQFSAPTKELFKVVKDGMGKVGDYIEENLAYLNVSVVTGLSFTENKLSFSVKQVRTPDFLSPKQVQELLDTALKNRAPGPILVPLDGMPFTLLELELDGNVAITKLARAPAASDGKR